MKLDSTDFELMDVPVRFEQDAAVLDARRRQLQGAVHPDRYANEDPAARRVAMQWAMRVNEAYTRLSDPLARAAYLCELNGVRVQAEDNTSMPLAFLQQQMQWRDTLDDASDGATVGVLADDVASHRAQALHRLAALLDGTHDFVAAAEQLRALMFLDRLTEDIDRRLATTNV